MRGERRATVGDAPNHMSTLLVSTADWDAPLWTNKQHVALALSRFSDVTYWNSLGLRSPRLNVSDLTRAVRRLRGGASADEKRPTPARLRVENPRVIPFHTNPAAAAVNGRLLDRAARGWREHTGSRLLWTYNPVTYGLERHATRVVYHCVDFLGQVEGVDGALIHEAEARLARTPGIEAVASSKPIANHLSEVGFERVHYWPNVAQVESFSTETTSASTRAGYVFAGNLTPTKVDFGALTALAATAGETLHIAGPSGIDGTTAEGQLRDLLGHPNVRYHGPLDTAQLSALFNTCRVGLIPYVANDYTRGVFPMKVYEYLASGLDVVASGLPALAGVEGVTLVDPRDLARAALERPPSTEESVRENRRMAAKNSWTERGRLIADLVGGGALA